MAGTDPRSLSQQFYDLCNLLTILTPPSDTHAIVFNGDFVDRGSWSVEVALTLFAWKWLYPKRIFLNRGNHEVRRRRRHCRWSGEERLIVGLECF